MTQRSGAGAYRGKIQRRVIVADGIDQQQAEDEYFRFQAAFGRVVQALGRPCHDCAVVFGLYKEISDALARQPEDVREAVSCRWTCHNHTDRACRGNIDNLAVAQPPRAAAPEEG